VRAEDLKMQEYVGRINRSIDYIRSHLTGDLQLETVARAANFAPYHFHRVFKAIVGETVLSFVRRTRIQKAASHLLYNPTSSITEIAVSCGYSSPSSFAREFRRTFEMSASQFRDGGRTSFQKVRDLFGDRASAEAMGVGLPAPRQWSDMVFSVEVVERPELCVAYVRHQGPYNRIGESFGRLFQWAGPRGLFTPDTQILSIYYEDPDLTPVELLSSDACMTVPEGTRTDREIGAMRVPGGLFAAAHVETDETQYGEAWDRLLSEWLPQSGYQPDDRLCYELYRNRPEDHPEKKHILDICEPIRPL